MDKAKPRDTWISEPGFRHFFHDADGVDHDIVNVIEALKTAKLLLAVAKCPDPDCTDGVVQHLPWGRLGAEVDIAQCQWCAEKKKLLDVGA